MAAIVAGNNLDLTALRAHLTGRLPSYARPLFLRIRRGMDLTSTFKYTKAELIREGYDPRATADPLYWNDPQQEAFVRIDEALYERIRQHEKAAAE
jgi:fatty-acyl-CoA synthase